MRKFRFKLEAVESLRKSRENEALRTLADAQRAFQQALTYKQNLILALEAALLRREQLANDSLSIADFQIETDFISGTKQRIIQADQAILRARRGVEKTLRAYLHARRQTRMMEVLREKAFQEYKRACAKHDQKELDDLYVMRARIMKEAV